MSETDGQDPPDSLPPTMDQVQELKVSIAQMVVEHLQFLVPGLSEDQLVDLGWKAAEEQLQIDSTILPTMTGEDAIAHPTLIMAILRQKDPSIGTHIKVPKVIDQHTEIGLVTSHVMLVALLTAPQLRAQLRALGFSYTFAQSKEVLQTASRLIQ